MKTTWILHCHHNVPCEPAIGPLEERLAAIRKKPAHEILLRLRLIRELTEPEVARLPAAYQQTWVAHQQAAADYREAWASYARAVASLVQTEEATYAHAEAVTYTQAEAAGYAQTEATFAQACAAYHEFRAACREEAMAAWHREVCVPDCPWDGSTLFPL